MEESTDKKEKELQISGAEDPAPDKQILEMWE